MSIFSDNYQSWSEEDLKALQTIDKMKTLKKRSSQIAIILFAPGILLFLIVSFVLTFAVDIHPGWSLCFTVPMFFIILFTVTLIHVLADRRIKRCEDRLLSGIDVKREKTSLDIFIMRNIKLFRRFSMIFFSWYVSVVICYYPINQFALITSLIILILFGFVNFIPFFGRAMGWDMLHTFMGLVIFIAVSCTLVDLIAGSAPLPILLVSLLGTVLFGGIFLAAVFISKKLKKSFGREAESRVKPALETIMTVETFNSGERLPYVDFGGGEKYEGNCCAYGKWNGTDVAFSNISFLTDVKIKEDPDKPMEMPYTKKRLEGICVFYTLDREPAEKMMEIIRYNLRQYQCYDVVAQSDHKIAVTLKNGYYFVEDRNHPSVCGGKQLECDAVKLNGVFEAIKAGVDHKKLNPRFETLTESDNDLE